MRNFEITTKTKFGTLVFLTKANNGKDALKSLTSKSWDYRQVLSKSESNNMTITVSAFKSKKRK